MKLKVYKTVPTMSFPAITYENNRVFGDIKLSIYSLISDKTIMSY